MELFTFLLVIGVFYSVIFFFDSFFKSCMHYPYDAFLRGTGLTVKFFRLHWYTTSLNRTILKWSTSFPKMFSHSFNIGVYISIFLLPIAFVMLLLSTITSNSTNVQRPEGEGIKNIRLEFMLPGVNLPTDEIIYYVIALAIASVVHELGHAIAGVMEDVPMHGFGFYILLIFPFASTELATEQLNSLKMWKKLRVLCAGIWHNILLAILAYLLFLMIPIVSMPFYELNSSVIVKDIKMNSPVYGVRGLQLGDVITEINDCKVRNLDSWYGCLLETIRNQPAYCVTTDYVHQNDESIQMVHNNDGTLDCCDSKNLAASCFEYISDSNYGELELPQHMCLNIRKTIENSKAYCHRTNKCDNNNFCIKPLMNNFTTILEISKNYQTNSMIYMGHPADLYQNVRISEFVPKTRYFPPELGDSISLLLKYIIVFSIGLIIVNIIPCFGLDGQHILSTILNQILYKKIPKKNRELISLSLTILGTLLLFINFIKSIWLSMFKVLLK